ncbi:uncharacterized protein METZ01_LOCUS308214, partial [marine metagenome]
MIKLGLIGAGRIGTLHARNIGNNNKCKLIFIYDTDNERANKVAGLYGSHVADTPENLINNSDIDAVLICSPTDTHIDMINLTAEAGKPIFCEKPIDLDIDRVFACIEKLQKNPVPFTIGFHRRFDLHHRALRDTIFNNSIGNVEQIRISSRDPAPPP